MKRVIWFHFAPKAERLCRLPPRLEICSPTTDARPWLLRSEVWELPVASGVLKKPCSKLRLRLEREAGEAVGKHSPCTAC